jgi:hypothetical protein
MFHRHHAQSALGPAAVPKLHTVRLLRSDEELSAARERARAFERRNIRARDRQSMPYDHYQQPMEQQATG